MDSQGAFASWVPMLKDYIANVPLDVLQQRCANTFSDMRFQIYEVTVGDGRRDVLDAASLNAMRRDFDASIREVYEVFTEWGGGAGTCRTLSGRSTVTLAPGPVFSLSAVVPGAAALAEASLELG
jgi:hypothetical protein